MISESESLHSSKDRAACAPSHGVTDMSKFLIRFLRRHIERREDTSFIARHREQLVRVINVGVLFLALSALGLLLAEVGFYLSDQWEERAHFFNVVILYGFVLQGALKLALARKRLDHIRSRWFEQALLMSILLYLLLSTQLEALLLSFNSQLTPDALARIYLAITQVFVACTFVPALLRYGKRAMTSNVQPSMLILLSFLILVTVGTVSLLLPRATVSQSISFVDALFTATSAVCVTGLIVVDTATNFTPFGHLVLMILIQVGGLGIMTLTTFFAFVLGGGARLKEYSNMQTLLGEDSLGAIKKTIVQIALVTFTIEGIGTYALYEFIGNAWSVGEGDRLLFSAFHSISAFCNAGFTLTTDNLAEGVLRSNTGLLSTIMSLIVVGGLGFPVLSNIGTQIITAVAKRTRCRLSLHSKLVLLTSVVLLVCGSVGFLLLEQNGTLRDLSFKDKMLASVFHSVTSRTAGFNILDTGSCTVPTLFLLICLMWIGASPGSTGGGIKTTTAVLTILKIHAIASGRRTVEIFRKRVPEIAITKAFTTVLLSFFFVTGALFCLLLTEKSSFEQLLFEVVSALSTVGLSTGITPQLTLAGKLIITICMIAGRVGLLAIVIALTPRRPDGRYGYTEENILIT